jgi:hypothetical protein
LSLTGTTGDAAGNPQTRQLSYPRLGSPERPPPSCQLHAFSFPQLHSPLHCTASYHRLSRGFCGAQEVPRPGRVAGREGGLHDSPKARREASPIQSLTLALALALARRRRDEMGDRMMRLPRLLEGHTPRLCLRSLHAAELAGSSTSTPARVNPWPAGQGKGQGQSIRRVASSMAVVPLIRPTASALRHGSGL